MSIQDRIREFRRVPAAELQANERNFRTHPKAQQEALAGILQEVGIANALIAYQSERYGGLTLIDGHLRLETHEGDWPVLILDVDDEEADLLLATMDPIGALAGMDVARLDELLACLDPESPALRQLLTSLAESAGAGALDALRAPGAGGDDFDATPDEEGPTRSQLGDLWQLGDHRLIVGDATDGATVAQLMAGEQAPLVFTDPPYGVAYVGKTRDALTIENDNLGAAGTRQQVADLMRAAPLQPGGVFYVCSPAGDLETAFRLALVDAELSLRQCLVWVKQQFVLGRQDYHWRHESILYGWREGAAHYFVNDRTQDTVWEVDRPARNADHPTMKPIALPERAISNSSRARDLVYDACGGSGTTLIACERQGRCCRMVELDPRYGDVILRRWEAETGRTATLVEREIGEPIASELSGSAP